LVHICKTNIEPDSVQINKVASCKNLNDVKHLKLDIKNETTEKYKNETSACVVNPEILKVQKPLSIMDLNCQYVVWQDIKLLAN
jgi:hypothetical protein